MKTKVGNLIQQKGQGWYRQLKQLCAAIGFVVGWARVCVKKENFFSFLKVNDEQKNKN